MNNKVVKTIYGSDPFGILYRVEITEEAIGLINQSIKDIKAPQLENIRYNAIIQLEEDKGFFPVYKISFDSPPESSWCLIEVGFHKGGVFTGVSVGGYEGSEDLLGFDRDLMKLPEVYFTEDFLKEFGSSEKNTKDFYDGKLYEYNLMTREHRDLLSEAMIKEIKKQ